MTKINEIVECVDCGKNIAANDNFYYTREDTDIVCEDCY
jgi:DNA-directed RNA polymerase subunit RPC12/RpoP